MRLVKQIENSYCTTNLYHYNNKYIIKFEVANLEQIYKVSEFDVTSIEDIDLLINEKFMEKVIARFREMSEDLYNFLEL